MTETGRSPLVRYGQAVTIAVAAAALRWLIDPWIGPQAPFLTLFAAIALSAWLAGLGPALATMLLGAIAIHGWTILTGSDAAWQPSTVAYLVYLVGGSLIILLVETGRRRGEQAQQSQRAQQRSESNLHAIVDALPMLISHVDANGRYRFNNRSYERWFGREPHQFEGRHVADVIGEQNHRLLQPAIERVMAGETVQFETDLADRDGGSRPVNVTYVPDRGDGRVSGYFALIEDIAERRRAELARAHLAEIVESSDDAIVSKSLDGTVQSWNRGAERLLGYRAEEIIGQSIMRLIPTELHNEETLIIERMRNGERITDLETERLHKDGRRVAVSLTISPIRDAGGRIIGASKIARDVSQRQAVEQALRDSEQRFRSVTESAPVLIWRTDERDQATWFNQSWLAFTGRSLAEQIGEGWGTAVHPDDLARVQSTFESHASRHEPFEIELRMQRRDGTWRWMMDRGVPMFDGPEHRYGGYIGFCVDITERKQAEYERIEADRRKDEFLATLAHELRNPLAPILTAVQAMQAQPADLYGSRKACDIIERQARHMIRLVEDLLDLSRVSRGRIALRVATIDIAQAIETAVESVRPLIDRAEHRLDLHLPAQPLLVDGDPTRLAQLIGNLLANAAKYTPAGGHLTLRLWRDDDRAAISIKDNGIGIPAELLEHIFEMFAQAAWSADGAPGGLGIGLTLARRLTVLHGGTIEAHSDGRGRGSEFIVRLPLSRSPAATTDAAASTADPASPSAAMPTDKPEPDPAAAPTPTGSTAQPAAAIGQPRPLRIVVADDNEDAATSLAVMLELSGHEVQTAHDGVAAIEVVARSHPDLVLLDIGMPKLDGYQVARQIRALPDGATLRLVALTGWGQESDRRRAVEAGFDRHFTKPIEFDQLQQLLDQTMAEIAAAG